MNRKKTILFGGFLVFVSFTIVFLISAKETTSSENVTLNQEVAELKELVTSLDKKVSKLEKRLYIVEEKVKFKVVPLGTN